MLPLIIKRQISYLRNRRLAKDARNDDRRLLNKDVAILTRSEEEDIDNLWGFFGLKPSWIRQYHRVYKSLFGFDKRYVPGCCYYPYIIRTLNPDKQYEVFENKAMLERLIPTKQPKSIARRISNIWFDRDFRPIDFKQVVHLVIESAKKTDLIIKPAQESCCGRGIKFVTESTSEFEIEELLKLFPKDVIIQKVVNQSLDMRKLNSTSLNCMRISTLNLNGRITPVNTTVKIGGSGMRVDNVGGCGGGSLFGINSLGYLSEKGVSSEDLVDLPVSLKTFQIPNYQSVINFAVECHKYLPHLGVAGWDIALDDKNEPILIEVNLWWPGIMLEQVAGPFFGDRTEEVLNHIRSKFSK